MPILSLSKLIISNEQLKHYTTSFFSKQSLHGTEKLPHLFYPEQAPASLPQMNQKCFLHGGKSCPNHSNSRTSHERGNYNIIICLKKRLLTIINVGFQSIKALFQETVAQSTRNPTVNASKKSTKLSHNSIPIMSSKND